MINMELWEKDIIEWINCSQLLTEPVKNTTELQDGVFYIKFLELIKWEKYENNSNQEDLILKFLEDEYPSFKVNKDDNTEHLYVASLLLVHLSRTITAIHDLYNASNLKYNMFDVLKHETQIRVKTFLENTLPLGKEITKETIVEVIMEVEDISCTPPPVAGFSHSPATRSARSKKIMTERIRELRELKSNLAVERFTNTDLREDVKMLQEKIQKLQKKLDEKSEQLKTLRKEQIKQNTPKPSRSKEDISREDYYKKYINDLTSQLNKQQDQIDELEEENDTLAKGLSSLQRTSVHYKENFTISERSLETLSSKIELKDRELVELRIHNEELRTYIKELNKNSNVEQSFEVEDVPLSMISQRRSLNTSEALSSVIEIQLQEAKEESAILNAQVDTLKGRLDILMKDYKTAMESNRDLQEKVKMLDQLQAKLNNTQKELNILNTDITNLQSEKMSFVAQNEDLKNLLSSNEKKLSEKEQSIATLNTELDNLKLEVTDLHELLENERINCTNLNISLTETKSQVAEHLTHINKLTDERNSYRSSIENYSKNIRDIFHCDQFIQISIDNLDNLTLDDLIKHIETMLHNYNTVCTSYKCDIEKLKAAVEETNKNLLEQQLTITTLEERNKQNLEEIRDEKHILEQNLLEVISNLQSSLLNKEQLLKSLMTRLEDIQYVNKDLKLIKETTQRNFAEYQENVQLIFEKLQRNYQTLHHELHQVQQEKEELECNFNRTNSELSDIQTRNTILEENLLENQKIISALKEQEKILYNELNECKQNVLQVKETNQALEEQYAMMKTEANNNLESLKSKNAKISHELKDVTDNFNLLQTKMNDTNKQVELKQAEINKLRLDVSFLREEKKSLIYSHKEELNAKDKEINIKEEAITMLEMRMKDMASESSSIIKELQEVRTSQFTMIASQEEALDRLKLENDKISLELKNTTDNLNLLQEKMNDTNTQMELKQKEINKLQLDVALLGEEKENLICMHKEELDAKDKEIEVKEEAIVTLQIKMDKIASETSSIIEDLQKVKTSQGAIITTQEATLESLKSENAKISVELCNVTDNLNSLEKKMNDTNTQMELKQKEINDLHLDVSLLRKEKENLICMHKEELNATDKEINIKEEAITTLEMRMKDMASESSSIIKELQEVRTSQFTMIASQEEALDRLKLENDKISLELKNTTDNLTLLQEKMNDTNTQMELKQKEINKVQLDVALLREEKENLICMHKEELDAKDKEIEVKEEAIVTLQIKMDKMASETSSIIEDLQKIKTSQGAIITTQEATLESLKSENAKISVELCNVTDNLNSLEKKMNDTNTQMELKQKEINDLHLDVSLLRKEKENLICMHKEELNATDKEINIKEEAITTLEIRMKDMASESSSIIKELQEVRTSQFTMIASQEEALDRLKLENDKISLELKNTTDNLILLQEKMNDTNTQMELKQKEINKVQLDVALLREEKENLICMHKEELDAKDKEIEVKEEAIVTLQIKMDKMTSETSSIIEDLQKVKTSQGAIITTQEATLESLKSENAKISVELCNVTDNLNSLEKKMNDTNSQMELKQKEINDLHLDVSLLRKEKENLICMHKEELDAKDKEINIKEEAITALEIRIKDMASESSSIIKELQEVRTNQFALIASRDADVEKLKSENAELLQKMKDSELQIEQLRSHISSLKLDKEHLICSHKEALEAKDKELGIKEEALIALQAKMDKLENKACITEKKMKEVIVNLQEVRSSQDAVLTTQEAALKEKCLHIEDLQEEFNSSKKILNKELENAKLSLRECQSNLLDVQNQINDKNKTIADQNTTLAELQEMLKKINAELETNKEHCKRTDASRAKIVKLCEKLEQPTKNLNSTIMEMCSSFDFLDQNLQDVSQYENIYIDNETADVLNIIKMTINQLHKSQKVISYLSCANAESNKTLEEQKILLENSAKDKEEICGLKNKIQELEVIAEKRNDYLKNLIKSKESLKESLQKIFASRNDLDNILISSKQKWNEILTKFQDILHIEGSVCDEFKQLQDKKTSLANALFKREIDSLENIKTISDILWKNFLWTEQKLRDTYLCSIHEKECLDVLTNAEEDQFFDEKMIIDVQLEKQKALRTDVIKSEEEMDSFTSLATWYENNLKSGKIKNQTEMEKKLQSQISQLTKEGKDLKNKIDSMRSRNVKLEKNIDDLRAEVKKLKSTETESTEVNTKEVESLKEQLEQLKQQNQLHEENLLQLHKEKDESIKIAKQKLESQLKEVHTSYERKLEDVKQKMKTAYNEQMSKFNKDQEKIVREKLQSQMEVMCQKQREELNRYKTHVSDLSSQLWTIGEKLIIEQKHHEDAVQRYRELQTKLKEIEADQGVATISRKTCTMAKQEMLPPESTQHRSQKVTTLITEETIERRHSIRNMQAMGNMFKAEDEDEIFDNVYLADMKRGNCLPSTDTDRLSILQMRNSLCKPHLKSSYPAEMQFLPPTLTEEEIKSGSLTEETFNDSLSQSLLPEQKARKKDRTQGNELKSPSSRILRERNADRRVTTTPHSLKNIFSLKRTQDENASSTPKGRRLSSLFRKSRIQSDR
ncbi:uncharacterized protein [Linepithema humile]|uniref:uncharacterized protein isoform X2 n=1 Tax=Linepithema humile TaxID=83485 RepID=UPI00351DDD66